MMTAVAKDFVPTPTLREASILIEGWRGINHSYCLVNQHQILALLKMPSVRLFHHDLPYFNPAWNRITNSAGLAPEVQQQIDAIPPAGGAHVDCIYRISSPVVCGAEHDRRKTLTFVITEMGLQNGNFDTSRAGRNVLTRDQNLIVTPSRWSRDRIVEFGFPPEKVHVVPLGVDTSIFYPLSNQERLLARQSLGISAEETVFLNVGGGLWNKGGDLLVHAFAALRARGIRARLIIKDQRGLYGVPFEQTVAAVAKAEPARFGPDVLSAISVIPGNLNPLQMRTLYGVADCYVSPYRAEGFNLPVLEAIACGSPVITTDGGATDDFCFDGVAVRIPGRALDWPDHSTNSGRYIEPDLDCLIETMAASGSMRTDDEVRQQVMGTFDWRRVAERVAALADNDDVRPARAVA